MQLDQVNAEARAFVEELFNLVEELAGARPHSRECDDWYTAYYRESPFVAIQPIGDRARKYQPNSILLRTKWDDELNQGPVWQTNDWWNQPAATLSARPDNPEEVELAKAFVRKAFLLHKV